MATNGDSEDEYSEYDEEAAEDLEMLSKKGMPDKAPYDGINPFVMFPIFLGVQIALGWLIGWGIYAIGDKALYDAKFETLKANDLGYFYLAGLFTALIPNFLQMFVMQGRKDGHVDNPDQYIYKTIKEEAYVKLEMEGPVGRFNRSQRGIDNFRETFGSHVTLVLLAGYVFPAATLAATVWIGLGRMAYSALYTKSASARGPGFMMVTLGQMALMGMVLFAAIKAF
mmetsp:Transcript_69259/g.122543  ORF Transcript_69259/g.122543 Transcript_69259/m.122543 type:complete len:226 (-) Transcript_69259:186-863(-)|eukprot:CAMPEP_0197651816 /NCGR_PEP_ID=MMETSP1338-20131121/34070_1 /TAXON_ID=43686 ORGANISM="Pelagodinium beii, Strain RCC1491" /NCGR_SAMPLE_ID=MMETSP1338 /ASSEMBLY_ACC=CAM_ASM_000754 /LENGTH=225 /DNA_ID=CAMNT_0043226557 /DNA_START=73 /DNA_END=750 /DNA_ORIENTATION=+